MQEALIDLAAGVFLSATIARPIRAAPVERDPLFVGFDTEYRPDDHSLLSVQFVLRGPDGRLRGRVYYPPAARLSVGEFAALLSAFFRDVGFALVHPKRRIFLVSHFAQAELGVFEDPLRDWRIDQYGKAHHAQLWVERDGDSKPWRLQLIDLFAFFPTSLARIGEHVGLPKVEVDPTQLERLLTTDRDAFERYAVRDAEIALVAIERFRAKVLDEQGIDVLHRRTTASVASDAFRRHFMTSRPGPVKTVPAVVMRRSGGGYQPSLRTFTKHAGSADVRLMACRAYWGGRNEAFICGLYKGPVVVYDVVSLYPHAALLQPLPNEKAKWKSVRELRDVGELEGFGHFGFEFPQAARYPCLPAVREGVGRLTFPRKGESWCTFSEVRAAIEMGARVRVHDAWGFGISTRESEHGIGSYVRALLEEKRRATKGTLEYETAKLLLNALIGKFNERRQASNLVAVERQARLEGRPSVAAPFARDARTRGAFRQDPTVGTLWAPEWSTLILGKARALMAPLIARGALHVSTDAVIVRTDVSMSCDALGELESVGSGLKVEARGDAAFVSRTRLYAVLRRPPNLDAHDGVPLAQNPEWAVVKVARRGSPETKAQFAHTVLACISAGADVAVPVQKERLLGANEAIRKERRLNERVVDIRKTKFGWDGKRVLRDRDVNPFSSFTETDPYRTLGKLEAAEHQRLVRAGHARRRTRVQSRATMDKVLAMLTEGRSFREIEVATGLPKSTVADLKRRLSNASPSMKVNAR